MRKVYIAIAGFVLVIIFIIFVISVISFSKLLNNQEVDKTALNNFLEENSSDTTGEPKYKVSEILDDLTNPWEISFVSKDFFYYTQRTGELRGHNLATQEDFLLSATEANVENEGGLLGLAVDNEFTDTRYLFACMNVMEAASKRIILVRYTLSENLKQIVESKNIIDDMPSNDSQRHSGCRVIMSEQGELWIGTGDTAIGELPQDPMSLGGKILRVDKDGKGVRGNLGAPFDNRIFSYGHRNTQGIALFNEPIDGVYGLSAEHGPDKDDEVNLIRSGNFGWDPIPGEYNEAVPMTDTDKFPDAIPAVWSSGDPTIAISGMTIIKGNKWKSWNGAFMIAVQKDEHIRFQTYDKNWNVLRDERLFLNEYGRIRTIVQSPGGDLFFLTDNGGNDKIVRITPE